MLIVLSLFITFFSSNSPNTTTWDLIYAAYNLEELNNYNWSSTVLHFLEEGLKKYDKEKPVTLCGCLLLIPYWLLNNTKARRCIPGREMATPTHTKCSINKIFNMDQITSIPNMTEVGRATCPGGNGGLNYIIGEVTEVMNHMDHRLTFDQWLDLRDNLILWDYSQNNGHQYCLGPGDDFRAVFRPIIKHLQKLHDKDQFNGNLRASITIHSQIVGNNPQRRIFEVEFTGDINFGDNFETGLRTDLLDLKRLVRLVTAGMPEGNWPDSLKLYLHPVFQNYIFENIREEGRYYIYFNPLFYDGADRNRLYHKICELRRRSDFQFQRHVTLTSQETSLMNWYFRIPLDTDANGFPTQYQHPLWQVYSNGSSPNPNYATSASIIRYLRNATHHYQDYSSQALSSLVNDQLYTLFPDACPKIFFEMVKHFRGNYGHAYFGIDLVSFLKDGPFGFTE